MALFILYYGKIKKKCCNSFLEWTNKHVAFTDNCLLITRVWSGFGRLRKRSSKEWLEYGKINIRF